MPQVRSRVSPGGSSSLLPRVYYCYAYRLKVAHISGYNRHVVDERRGRNESIAIGSRVWNVEGCATLGYNSINRKYASGERR